MKKIISCLVIIAVVVTIFCTGGVFASDEEAVLDKDYKEIDYSTNFDDSCVFAVIRHACSGYNKQFEKTDFPGLDIDYIEYMTPLIDEEEALKLESLNHANYKQILLIHLNEHSKEKVVASIDILMDNDLVYTAYPLYNFAYDGEPTFTTEEEERMQYAIKHAVVVKRPDGSRPYYDDRVMVTFKCDTLQVYGVYPSGSDFSDIPMKYFSFVGVVDKFNKESNFMNMGVAIIPESGQQNVIDTINTLKDNFGIYMVEPIYYEDGTAPEGEYLAASGAKYIEYCCITDSYYDDRLVVAIDINSEKEELTEADLADIDVAKIEEINSENYKTFSDLDTTKCKKIYTLYLKASGREVVNAAIAKFAENEDIYAVSPAYKEEYVIPSITIDERFKDRITAPYIEKTPRPTEYVNPDFNPNVDGNEKYLVGEKHFINNEEYIKGDVTGDKNVTARDALAILKYCARLADLDEAQKDNAEVSLDGKVTVEDALIVISHSAKVSKPDVYEMGFDDCIKTYGDNYSSEFSVRVVDSIEGYNDFKYGWCCSCDYRDFPCHHLILFESYYNEEYFKDNSLVIVTIPEESKDITVNYMGYNCEEGKYTIEFNRYYPKNPKSGTANNQYFISIEGKDMSEENIDININGIHYNDMPKAEVTE